MIRRSSEVERSAVNRCVVGSNPTAGAIWRRSRRARHRPVTPGRAGSSPAGAASILGRVFTEARSVRGGVDGVRFPGPRPSQRIRCYRQHARLPTGRLEFDPRYPLQIAAVAECIRTALRTLRPPGHGGSSPSGGTISAEWRNRQTRSSQKRGLAGSTPASATNTRFVQWQDASPTKRSRGFDSFTGYHLGAVVQRQDLGPISL